MTEREQDIRDSIDSQKELHGSDVDTAYLLDVIDELRKKLAKVTKERDDLFGSDGLTPYEKGLMITVKNLRKQLDELQMEQGALRATFEIIEEERDELLKKELYHKADLSTQLRILADEILERENNP